MQPTLSIIIPSYNSGKFIVETILSAQSQSFKPTEIIVVDDGSTDDTPRLIEQLKKEHQNIKYIQQPNAGVSAARNNGFQISRGKYVLFLDADDLMAEHFLRDRIDFLEEQSAIGFCGSRVIKIDENGDRISSAVWQGTSENLLSEVLSFNPRVITCPSNYLIRSSILHQNNVTFNTKLGSSADRFFLIQLSQYTKGALLDRAGMLLYRIHAKSMSNNFSAALVQDHLLFREHILLMKNIPRSLMKDFIFKTNYICAGSYFKLRRFIPCLKFSFMAFLNNPSSFVKQLSRR